MAAGIRGALVLDEDSGCLLLESENGTRSPVVWPAGASWRANPPAVKLQGQLIELGMFVEGAGGALHYDQVEEFAGTAVADAAQACAGPTGEVVFFNPGSDVSVIGDQVGYSGSGALVPMRSLSRDVPVGGVRVSARSPRDAFQGEKRRGGENGPVVPNVIDPELRVAIEARAEAEHTTTSEIIREAIRRFLEVA